MIALWRDVREIVHEQVQYRDLLFQMAKRDLVLRYKQTFMAYRAYERGDLRAARARLWQVKQRGLVGWRESSYLLISYLPSGVVNSMRRVKHALQRSAP